MLGSAQPLGGGAKDYALAELYISAVHANYTMIFAQHAAAIDLSGVSGATRHTTHSLVGGLGSRVFPRRYRIRKYYIIYAQ